MVQPQPDVVAGVLAAEHVWRQLPQRRQSVPGHIWKCMMLVVVAGVEEEEVLDAVVREGWIHFVHALVLTQRLAEVRYPHLPEKQGQRPVVIEPAEEAEGQEQEDVDGE